MNDYAFDFHLYTFPRPVQIGEWMVMKLEAKEHGWLKHMTPRFKSGMLTSILFDNAEVAVAFKLIQE